MPKFRKCKITTQAIAQLEAGQTLMDSDQPGFGVRRQRDVAVFFVRKFARGQRHYQTIGEVGTNGLTVTIARQKAGRIIMAIQDGMSPSERRARDSAMPTLLELSGDWMDAHVVPKLKPKTAEDYRSTICTHITPVLGRLRVDQVDEAAVARMHHRARATPYAANRALAVLSKMMGYAERVGLRQSGSNPVKGIERYREHRRQRYLTSDEYRAVGAALSSPEVTSRHSPYAVSAIGFLLLTGMRLREVLRLRWADVDLERGLILLADSKTGPKPVVLGAQAVRLLATLPRTGTSDWVFPSAVTPNQPMYDVKKTWRTVAAVAGLADIRIHDLRHSFASIAAGSGGSLPMIGKLLGHAEPASTARYAHLANDPLRELADRTSDEIGEAMVGSNVWNRR